MDPDLRLDEMMTVPVRRDLQGQALVAHRVVVADDAFFLYAQSIAHMACNMACKRDEGRSRVLRLLCKQAIVFGKIYSESRKTRDFMG